jgi:GH25 family lysozyme M1 (1,4-beta-N-acetylmuramidase)
MILSMMIYGFEKAEAIKPEEFFPLFNRDLSGVIVRNPWGYDIPTFSSYNGEYLRSITGENLEIKFVNLETQKAYITQSGGETYIPTLFFSVVGSDGRHSEGFIKEGAHIYLRNDRNVVDIRGIGRGNNQVHKHRQAGRGETAKIVGIADCFFSMLFEGDGDLYLIQQSDIELINRLGSDVSGWQSKMRTTGESMNFEVLRDQGISFVMIKLGGVCAREIYEDSAFRIHFEKAKRAGIPVGFYFVPRYENERDVYEQADFVLKALSGKNFEFPIALDIEACGENDDLFERLHREGKLISLTSKFLEILREKKYLVSIYANYWFLKNRLYLVGENTHLSNQLKPVFVWMALWSGENPQRVNYSQDCAIWQYTLKGDGKRFGAFSDGLDLDISYIDFGHTAKSEKLNGY